MLGSGLVRTRLACCPRGPALEPGGRKGIGGAGLGGGSLSTCVLWGCGMHWKIFERWRQIMKVIFCLGPRGWLLNPDSNGSDLFSSASILGGRLRTPLLNTQGKLFHSFSFFDFGFVTEIARLVLSRIVGELSGAES